MLSSDLRFPTGCQVTGLWTAWEGFANMFNGCCANPEVLGTEWLDWESTRAGAGPWGWLRPHTSSHHRQLLWIRSLALSESQTVPSVWNSSVVSVKSKFVIHFQTTICRFFRELTQFTSQFTPSRATDGAWMETGRNGHTGTQPMFTCLWGLSFKCLSCCRALASGGTSEGRSVYLIKSSCPEWKWFFMGSIGSREGAAKAWHLEADHLHLKADSNT